MRVKTQFGFIIDIYSTEEDGTLDINEAGFLVVFPGFDRGKPVSAIVYEDIASKRKYILGLYTTKSAEDICNDMYSLKSDSEIRQLPPMRDAFKSPFVISVLSVLSEILRTPAISLTV